jgi:hypothetical protein
MIGSCLLFPPHYFHFVQALLEYEKHKRQTGEIQLAGSLPLSARVEKEVEFSFFVF